MAIHKSGEDYLETILMIQNEKGSCRSVDISRHRNVSKPSVSVAMETLRNEGLITTDNDGLMHFTVQGQKIAEDIYSRHVLLTNFLIQIGVQDDIAEEDACRIEHDISPETIEALQKHITNFEHNTDL